MKKVILATCLTLLASGTWAQKSSQSYIVRTNNVVVNENANASEGADSAKAKKHIPDFVNDNFKYYSLCDWKKGMRFMVMPERYDMIVSTFCDASTEREVSSVKLRNKIMQYLNHTMGGNGHERVNFYCEDDQHKYFFEIPNGSFDDYCAGKLGVPTLAYLGDVDIADSLLKGHTVFTTAKTYYRDSPIYGEGAEEVQIPGNLEVEVVAVGVGTRNFPVKIIVKDKDGNQFFQNVAISKTNCGMRDNEFIMDNEKHTFYGSFGLMDALTPVSSQYQDYIGKMVFTKHGTKMMNEKSQKLQGVPRMTGFLIESIHPLTNTKYVTLRLKNNATAGYFLKDVTFDDASLSGDSALPQDDYFGYLFAEGTGKQLETSIGSRAMINVGHVGTGFSEDEVLQAVGEPERTEALGDGRYNWYYTRSQGAILVVKFGVGNTVIGTEVIRKGNSKRNAKK